jgi:ATP-binding cassette subfamily C protein LapB
LRNQREDLNLQVGERGMALSGGQRQAVAIARALLQDPPILLLDEPTSQMDSASESALKQRLRKRLEDETLILITHRASLLALVDRLIVLDGGKVVADGPRDAVLDAIKEGRVPAMGPRLPQGEERALRAEVPVQTGQVGALRTRVNKT